MVAPTLNTSPFERYVSPGSALVKDPWDEVLFESKNFVVVPTAGSIVEGWLLVIPRVNALAFADVVERQGPEAEEVLSAARAAVEAVYGSSVVFEHGPDRPGSEAGCTIDHAHLHVLPSVTDFKAGAHKLLPDIMWKQVRGISDLASLQDRSCSYLYLDEGDPMVGFHDRVPSQLFRRVVAQAVGQEDEYNWKTHPHRENAERTVHTLGPVLQAALTA